MFSNNFHCFFSPGPGMKWRLSEDMWWQAPRPRSRLRVYESSCFHLDSILAPYWHIQRHSVVNIQGFHHACIVLRGDLGFRDWFRYGLQRAVWFVPPPPLIFNDNDFLYNHHFGQHRGVPPLQLPVYISHSLLGSTARAAATLLFTLWNMEGNL